MEKWVYGGVTIDSVDFGTVDYSSAEPILIYCVFRYKDLDLLSDIK